MNLPQLLTPKEVREALKIGRGKMTELIRERRLDVVRLGTRSVRVKSDSVTRLMEG